jgi:hypothetical protein
LTKVEGSHPSSVDERKECYHPEKYRKVEKRNSKSPKTTIQNQLQNVMSDWGCYSVRAMWMTDCPVEPGETRACDVAG